MTEKMYTAAEIAEMRLPNLPTTKANILARAEKENWHFEERIGLGGHRKLFRIPALYLEGYVPPGQDNQSLQELNENEITKNARKTALNVTAASHGREIDAEALANAVEIVDTYLETHGKRLSRQRKGEVIVVVYNYLIGNKKESALLELMRLVA